MTWQAVQEAFRYHYDGPEALHRLIGLCCEAEGLPRPDLKQATVVRGVMHSDALAEMLQRMAALEWPDGTPNTTITDEPPRQDGVPIVLMRYRGREWLIDGRRRANKWARFPGHYPTMTIHCEAPLVADAAKGV